MLMQNILAKPAAAAMRRLLRWFIGGAKDGTGGVAAVEFALILPILVLMMIGAADFGMGFYRKMQVYDAAQAGAQWAAANGFDSTKISTAVTRATTPDPKNSWTITAIQRRTRIVDALQARASRLTATRLPFVVQDVRMEPLRELTSPRRRRPLIRPCCPILILRFPTTSPSRHKRRYASSECASNDIE